MLFRSHRCLSLDRAYCTCIFSCLSVYLSKSSPRWRDTHTLVMHFSMVPATAALLALLPATIASPRGLYRRDSATGQCGAANGNLKCDASTGNTCCSVSGWCGDSSDHCGTGCQSAYGVCSLSLYLHHH